MKTTIVKSTVSYRDAKVTSTTLYGRANATTALSDQLLFEFLGRTGGVSRRTLVDFIVTTRKVVDNTDITNATAERFIRTLTEDGCLTVDTYDIVSEKSSEDNIFLIA